jgi:hypothetical protein
MNQIMKGMAAALLLALAACGQAGETVEVKYHGKVSLQGFECTDTQSSFVHRICYAESDKYLLVQLKDTYYHYCRMPPRVVNAWLAAESKGGFYNANIKGRFGCREGGVP